MQSQFWQIANGYLVLCYLSLSRLLLGGLGLSKVHHLFIVRQLKKTGLFDSDYYLSQHPDAGALGFKGLLHFVTVGDVQGALPTPVFDPAYYRSQAASVWFSQSCNSLLHYVLLGRYLAKSPCYHFDVAYYLRANPDVANSGMEPLRHFLHFGGLEGRNPSRLFNAAHYLNEHSEVARQHINPLVHFLTSGYADGAIYQAQIKAALSSLPELPACSEWLSILEPYVTEQSPQVDVIVPVYKDKSLTLRCLYSVLQCKQNTPFELIVINDGSPDEELVLCLRDLARQNLITLLENDGNQGYVFSANCGMNLHADRDVVQLNSDAEVFNDWLDRLRACAYHDEQIGTVTPLSNNATICSYPVFIRDNPEPLEIEPAELDALAAVVNQGGVIDVPTGVGFCMYIRRGCIAVVGDYDQEAFGRGYGEENDFCQRALKNGWRNLIAADVFVKHHGSASFQGDKADLVAHAMRKINELHPNYHKDVAQFVSRDPVAVYRRNLDNARLKRCMGVENALLISHNLGGGTERFVQEEAIRLKNRGVGAFLMRPYVDNSFLITTSDIKELVNLPPFELDDITPLLAVIKELQITDIQFHHIVGFDIKILDFLTRLAQQHGIRLSIQIHDYLAICPRINLVDELSVYCGEPSPEQCNRCLKTNGSRFDVFDITPWRQQFHLLLQAAHAVIVPDEDVALRLNKYFSDIPIKVQPHESPEDFIGIAPVVHQQQHDKLKIVTIGAISQIKGFDVLLACAEDAQIRHLPLEFVVLGYTANDTQAKEAGITVTGRYNEAEGVAELSDLQPNAVFLPSVWPETYCYTLSLALTAGLPVFAFDLGAIATRLKACHCDQNLMSLNNVSNASLLNDWIMTQCQKNHH